jgi:hypothetical protein
MAIDPKEKVLQGVALISLIFLEIFFSLMSIRVRDID